MIIRSDDTSTYNFQHTININDVHTHEKHRAFKREIQKLVEFANVSDYYLIFDGLHKMMGWRTSVQCNHQMESCKQPRTTSHDIAMYLRAAESSTANNTIEYRVNIE